jgi:hypothetical protein
MMADAVTEYEKLAKSLIKNTDDEAAIQAGQMFGKPCLKVNGKAFLAQHKDAVIFKLTDPHHTKALALSGANLWDPSGKGRAMKEWVAVPATEVKSYTTLAKAALAYVVTGA